MKKHSQFTRIAVATGLVLSSSAAVLGVTSFASAKGGASARLGVTSTAVAGQQSMKHQGRGPMGGGTKSEALAKVLNLTATELQTQLKSGKSLADIAKTQNVAITAVTAVLIADFKTHLDAEVASGKHTQAEATVKLTEFTARVTDMVNGVRSTGGPMGGKKGGGTKSEALAKVLNLTATELQTQLKSGKSLADIAKTQNVAITAVTAVLIADFKTHLDAEVASGKHTQAEATAKLTEFTARVTDMVNGVRPTGGPMGGKHGGGRQHGKRGFGGPAMSGSQAPSMSGTALSA
jgi:methyl coenzyme M reductase subunit D